MFNLPSNLDGCVLDNGDLAIHGIAIKDIVSAAKDKNIQLPLILRFPELIEKNIKELTAGFKQAFDKYNYLQSHQLHNKFWHTFPVKVNPNHRVLDAVITGQKNANLAGASLEVGSKPELILALSMLEKGIIVCNGYKDENYLKLALLASSLGYKIFLVIDQIDDLHKLVKLYKDKYTNSEHELQITLGIRLKLLRVCKGKWSNTCGEYSKFGLTKNEINTALCLLKQHGLLDKLKLLHAHFGSQISSLKHIKKCLQDYLYMFVKICAFGVKIDYLDIGGGIGVDYRGIGKNKEHSIDYNFNSYADMVVKNVLLTCVKHKLAYPAIISESGRAIVANHAILLANVYAKNNVVNKNITQYLLNFSIFQSLPDVCLVDQVFPTSLIQGLNSSVKEKAILADLTCDSDGAIKKYVNGKKLQKYLLLPKNNQLENKIFAFFLIGAYQEVLSSQHNLFGNLNVVEIALDQNNNFIIEHVSLGDKITDMLSNKWCVKNKLLTKLNNKVQNKDNFTLLDDYSYLNEHSSTS